MAWHNETGKNGEKAAFRYLMQKGYRILASNWVYQHKELDLVVTDGQWLIVVEVKTRNENTLVSPLDAVNRQKQRNICFAADAFARSHSYDMPIRYDVLSVIFSPATDTYRVEHIENAFYPELNRACKRRF